MVDLLEIINKDKPDLGPFVDSKHKQVEEGQLIMLYDEVFKRCLKTIIEGTRSSSSLQDRFSRILKHILTQRR
ncbi:hypothetical protein E2320_013906 [Naja naja]|nr:hypothetical protein E2320_013906 [Naja naja]